MYAARMGGEQETAALLHRRVGECFGLIWQAWANRDADLLKPYVSDKYLAESRRSLAALDREAQTHQIEDDQLWDVAVPPPEGEASARAYLAFAARHSIVDLRTGAVVGGDATTTKAWTGRWTFVLERRRGWVVDRLETVGRVREGTRWPGLPPGVYSLRSEPATWVYWDGAGFREADQALLT